VWYRAPVSSSRDVCISAPAPASPAAMRSCSPTTGANHRPPIRGRTDARPLAVYLVLAGIVVGSGCGQPDEPNNSATSSTSTSASTDGASSTSWNSSSTTTTWTTTSSETASTDTCASSECTSGPGPGEQCNIWKQDCPEGYKCDPYDEENSSFPSEERCVPLDPAPKQYGEDCEIFGPGWLGDNCDEGLMCWWGGILNQGKCSTACGVCRHYCKGSTGDPLCPQPDDLCWDTQSGAWGVCYEACDPLAQDCYHPLDACDLGYLTAGIFFYCGRDQSDPRAPPMDGETCSPGGCGAGRFCFFREEKCTSFCDVNAPNTCELKVQGAECVSFISIGWSPTPGMEHVGYCGIP
jgi:hypothetical protein